ncbi:phosphonate ABC transporter ATP-binding protein [Cytobacillus sp. S13-E01]|uniref:phosphonate ABC transporter ATP-binding protein n=1 Tax=Cytobacillus sp. S13-E01 TaxID=3031326 RepID=UPI0023D83F89|nr:phosphonate ABC transporter ATP-binding protein [Cytobacillus sp. S13-E01]MDF0725535.1 phosphonate ABC transporter ATP-binding protein [Cytobacillus sp. S13-E01]
MIELKNVSVRYPGTNNQALKAMNLTLKEGEFVCILGKSGAGKSTLIRCMNGLQKPTNGDVYWDRKPLSSMNSEEERKVRREMGMIFQHFNLIPRLTVLQNALTGMFGYRNTFKNLVGWFTKEEIAQAKQVIADVGLSDFIERRIEQLSGGQKQRVGIARALLQEPRVFLGDEPVASLDPGTANLIFTLLQELHQRHKLLTVINVHDVTLAKQYATRILALKNGELIFDGKPEEFSEEAYVDTYGAHRRSYVLN